MTKTEMGVAGLRRGMLGAAAAAVCTLALASGAQAQSCTTFLEQNGLVVIEVESTPPAGQWVAETSNAGFTGTSYYRWNGPDLFSSPGQGVLRYEIEIQSAGTYRMAVHNRHNHPDSSLENDMWVRMDGGAWIKSYSNSGAATVNTWNWHTKFEVGAQHLNPDFVLSAGVHVLEFSGRSKNFRIDRFHLAKGNHPDAQNKNAPQSPCAGGDASTYCTAKVNSAGCTPQILAQGGQPSASSGAAYLVPALDVINNQGGIFIYGLAPASVPFQGGTLCVATPVFRAPPTTSGGNGTPGTNCSGRLVIDFNAYIASGANALLLPGVDVFGQFWYRDPAIVGAVGLTNAIHMTIQP